MSLNGSLHSSRFVFIVFALQWKRRGKKQTNTKEWSFPLYEVLIDALTAAPSNLSSLLAPSNDPHQWGGVGVEGVYSKPLLKSTLVLRSQKFLKVALKRLHEVSLHILLFFLFFLLHHLLSKWKKATLFPVYFLGASPLKLPCVLAVEDWAVCMGKCTSAVSLPNQIEFWCRACVFLRSKKPSHFFSL